MYENLNFILYLCIVPENPVFILKYGDRILFFYLPFVPDTIYYFKIFLKNFFVIFFGFCTRKNCEKRKNHYKFETLLQQDLSSFVPDIKFLKKFIFKKANQVQNLSKKLKLNRRTQWRNYSSAFGANAPPKFFEKKNQHSPPCYIFT